MIEIVSTISIVPSAEYFRGTKRTKNEVHILYEYQDERSSCSNFAVNLLVKATVGSLELRTPVTAVDHAIGRKHIE